MVLRIFNTMGRRIEEFVPIEPNHVRMYTCGPTVYDLAHIGNFRTFVFQDVLRRYLKYKRFEVTQVMNITDVDDKTIRGAKAEGIPLRDYTERYVAAFFQDMQALDIEPAEHYPRATEHIGEMLDLIRLLLAKEFAYEREGSIYYSVSKNPSYGKLSALRSTGTLLRKAILSDNYSKEEASDFALWKAWDEEDGDVFWDSPYGKGRPGWHIECSAMSMRYLGESFDIHTGGVDLIFPHHENEIAQSEAVTSKAFVRYWVHSEHLLVRGEKMSKSLGNYYTLRDLLNSGYSPNAIRYLLLSGHYRQRENFTEEALKQAEESVERLSAFVERLANYRAGGESSWMGEIHKLKTDFEESMDEDLNTPKALASLFEFVRKTNKRVDEGGLQVEDARSALDVLRSIDSVFRVIEWRRESLPPQIEEMIMAREAARKGRDWATADRIRSQLTEMGILLEDTPTGVVWRKKRLG